ncbi:hypothetical protein SAMN05421846_110106 [Chryseobacterium taeanense]|uniref:Uncharacterized protein n=1 Tax=Chryseobacterium taeanense TaxID=311334 RepID=A0A1G8LYA2_9FLAO|nr:hypothetical protein [Chryseobacterium taeanense]SDI60681.1 hypothetical protein SAMN05421846_110106 [Chryseobacterium taeanense]
MRLISVIAILFTLIFYNKQTRESQMIYTENEILKQLDLAYKQEPSEYYPKVRSQDIKYNFFLDLEHGYFETAGSRIHLYANENQWAIVFEKSGYQNRATRAEIELDYIGNCINYPIDRFPDRDYISNVSNIVLIDSDEYMRIENKNGTTNVENFELIANDIEEIKVRGKLIPFNNNYKDYERVGINIRDYDNPKKLIGFGDLIRFYHETNPILVSASEDEIKKYIPKDLKRLMVIDEFHYDPDILPSKQEVYKLISKILITKDTSYWKPTQQSNNSWKKWESGNL